MDRGLGRDEQTGIVDAEGRARGVWLTRTIAVAALPTLTRSALVGLSAADAEASDHVVKRQIPNNSLIGLIIIEWPHGCSENGIVLCKSSLCYNRDEMIAGWLFASLLTLPCSSGWNIVRLLALLQFHPDVG